MLQFFKFYFALLHIRKTDQLFLKFVFFFSFSVFIENFEQNVRKTFFDLFESKKQIFQHWAVSLLKCKVGKLTMKLFF